MRFVILSTIGIRGDKRAIFKLHGGAEATSLILADGSTGIEHESVFGEVELETILCLRTEQGAHPPAADSGRGP